MERIRARALFLWLLFLLGAPVQAANDGQGPPPFKPEEIEALVAPIALYPDTVLSQVLMASTYPLEIVHAARWAKANPALKGDAAVKAVANQSWDASVKSLVAFPQILEPMNDKLDWTQHLGDAFLAQQQDVFAAVQRLRVRAQEAGNLQSNAQQKVTMEPATANNGQAPGNKASASAAPASPPPGSRTSSGQAPSAPAQVVRIESANPEVIYVPAYNPTVVYGGWSAPAYPPTYWPPYPAYYPGAALMSGLAWGVGLAAAGAIFSDCDWGGGDVDIDYNKVTNIDRNIDRSKVQGQGGRWQHDASHRQGVAYRDTATREKFAGQVPGADKRAQYRGRGAEPAPGAAPAAIDRSGAINRAAAGNRSGAERGAAVNRPAGGNRAVPPDRSGATSGPSAAGGPSPGDRQAAPDRGGGMNRAAVGEGPGAGNRAMSSDRSAATNRGGLSTRGAVSSRGGATGTRGGRDGDGRDSAFAGVGGGGAAAQRSYDRGRSSMQGSGFSRSPGGGGRGGGGRGGGGRR